MLVHNKRSGLYSNLRSNDSNDHLLIIPYVRQKHLQYAHSVYMDPDFGIVFQQKLKQ